jgi:hypothetical protein
MPVKHTTCSVRKINIDEAIGGADKLAGVLIP